MRVRTSIASGPNGDAAFVLAGAAEVVVLGASEDDDADVEEDRATGVVDIESKLVELASEVREALVVEDMWVEGTVLPT